MTDTGSSGGTVESQRKPQTMFEAMDEFGAARHELWLLASRPLVHLLDWLVTHTGRGPQSEAGR